MAEGREQEIRSVAPDRANDVARLAGRGVRAFNKREVAIRCCAKQRLEICAGVIGGAPCAPRWSSTGAALADVSMSSTHEKQVKKSAMLVSTKT
jgi:hypothetical protein